MGIHLGVLIYLLLWAVIHFMTVYWAVFFLGILFCEVLLFQRLG